jgi:hypothetical protein
MRLIKGNFFNQRKSEFGDFELQADEGWKISSQFIDYESKLLYVCTNDEDQTHWMDTGAGRTIPTKHYLIDPVAGRILAPAEWALYFSYEPTEIISADGKYKLLSVRVHDADRIFDSFEEKLIDLTSGHVSTGWSVAFRDKKRENMLDSHYRAAREQQERIDEVARMPTLALLHERQCALLKYGDTIVTYYTTDRIFRLTYVNAKFELSMWSSRWSNAFTFLEAAASVRMYDKLEDYAAEFLNSKQFYLDHLLPHSVKDAPARMVLKKFVVSFMNGMRERHDFSHREYGRLGGWENFFYESDSVKPSEYRQYCPNCKKAVEYTPRYPKYICRECSEMTVDEAGVELVFSNLGFSGGLKITYKAGDQILKEDTTQTEKLCLIDGKSFVAIEGRFGGVVIQALGPDDTIDDLLY